MIRNGRYFVTLLPRIKLFPNSLGIDDRHLPLTEVRKPQYKHFMFLAWIQFFSKAGIYFVWGFRFPVRNQFREMMRHRNTALQVRRDRIGAERERRRATLAVVTNESKLLRTFLGQDIYISRSRWECFQIESVARINEIPTDLHDHMEAKYLLKFRANREAIFKARNDAFVMREIEKYRTFFDDVESQPLTREQRIACVTFEDCVLLVAAAGSGKSSTLVAKVGYAILKGIVRPSEILVLAFNRNAAKEVKERIEKRLRPYGDPEAIDSLTFHSLGLRIIKRSVEEGFAIASCDWEQFADSALKISKIDLKQSVPKIYNQLVQEDMDFRTRVLQYLAIHGGATVDTSAFSSWDEYKTFVWFQNKQNNKTDVFLTLDGNEVTTPQARTISDWLFINGVEYRYRQQTAWTNRYTDRVPYRPEFYYPGIDLWHDHFALDQDGASDPYLGEGYRKVIDARKRTLENSKAHHFITTNAMLADGSLFDEIARNLFQHGIQLKPRSAEDIQKAIDDNHRRDSFTDTLARFIELWKASDIKLEELREKAGKNQRYHDFIWIADRILSDYNAALAEENAIDFSDMINKANTFVDNNAWMSQYKLILVDEFQDISLPRAALVKNIMDQVEGPYLFGVGDDWQAINGFAGSELSIMRNFGDRFGPTAQLYLTQTFRSNQGIANIASDFIMKNPAQFRKEVRALDQTIDGVIQYVEYDGNEEALNQAYPELVREILSLGAKSIKILCRTNNRVEAVTETLRELLKELQVTEALMLVEIMTMHGSKGLEADYVILDRMENRKFPMRVPTDSIFMLVMPEGEDYQDAEERRLMYVALTRARKGVYVLVSKSHPSCFIEEIRVQGKPKAMPRVTIETCPACLSGFLKLTKNEKSWGCSQWIPGGGGCDYMRWNS